MKNKISQEKITADKMILLYCSHKHQDSGYCEECLYLREYVHRRLDKCPWGENKPVCSKCKTHCYNMEMRKKIQKVMRYSGPRMIIYHPMDFLRYIQKKYC